jgi:hypothetical protein
MRAISLILTVKAIKNFDVQKIKYFSIYKALSIFELFDITK